MNSFWEKRTYLSEHQDVVLGAGIVGLFTAMYVKKSDLNRRVVVVDRHPFSAGASTKNAGFACFGSPSEILDDLSFLSENDAAALVEMRWKGLENLRFELGDEHIDYQAVGGFELFKESDKELWEKCVESLDRLNRLVANCVGKEVYKNSDVFKNFNSNKRFIGAVENSLEGSIDTGKMMVALRRKCRELGVEVLTGEPIDSIDVSEELPSMNWCGEKVYCERLFICTNGFTSELIPEMDVKPARNQVVVTSPFSSPIPSGTFHVDKGYIYFRGVENRLLIGGFRNTDIEGESTSEFGLTENIQSNIRNFITDYITQEAFEIDYKWSGIMGVGTTKFPILKKISPSVFVGVRMGGMGVAIGSLIGKKLAEMAK